MEIDGHRQQGAMPVSIGLRDNDVLWHVVGGHKVKAANIAVDPFNFASRPLPRSKAFCVSLMRENVPLWLCPRACNTLILSCLAKWRTLRMLCTADVKRGFHT